MLGIEQTRADKIRILLADDHPQVRTQLVARLERENDFELIGVAASSTQTLRDALAKKPCVLLLDPIMRDGLGLTTLRQLHNTVPELIVVVLTAYVDTSLKMELHNMGITHILVKGIPTARLLDSLRTAARFPTKSS